MSDWNDFGPDRMMRRLDALERLGGYVQINGAIPWNERFALYRHNYRTKAGMVASGLETWFHSDPYQIADWMTVFTPIEAAVWHDIRCSGLSMWPQLPVGRYFLDFGNPVAKIAIECDGRQFHDEAKDALRDAELESMGWEVLRIPGWRCKKEAPDLDPDMTDAEREERRAFINDCTPAYEIAYAGHLLSTAEEACRA